MAIITPQHSQSIQAPRGAADILPEEQKYWRFVEDQANDLCVLRGYHRIETPVFEETRLFVRSVGEGTDIVEKEMYTFEDKGGTSLTLRPEGTAPVCRAYLEHGLHNQPQPVKLYYLASIFRYERPQAGRYRQHHQFGFEAIGEQDPALDAEIIEMAWNFFSSLGLKDFTLQLNSIGDPKCRPQYLEALKAHYAPHEGSICRDCRVRLVKNPLRLLDCKEPSCQPVANSAPKTTDYLCDECAAHYSKLKNYLDRLEIPYQENHRLVRGLDYYAKTVFEIQPLIGGSQSTLGGGGRYDGLIEELGGKPTPGIGFATGIERIIMNLKSQNVEVPELVKPQLFIAYMGEAAKEIGIRLVADLRYANIPAVLAFGDRSLKAQLRQANALKLEHAVIIGEEEVHTDTVILRDMISSEQTRVLRQDVVRLFRKGAYEATMEDIEIAGE